MYRREDITIASEVMGKNARVNAYQVPADPTAVVGRRIAAYIIDVVIINKASQLIASVLPQLRDQIDLCVRRLV